jgi:hypothetical protein
MAISREALALSRKQNRAAHPVSRPGRCPRRESLLRHRGCLSGIRWSSQSETGRGDGRSSGLDKTFYLVVCLASGPPFGVFLSRKTGTNLVHTPRVHTGVCNQRVAQRGEIKACYSETRDEITHSSVYCDWDGFQGSSGWGIRRTPRLGCRPWPSESGSVKGTNRDDRCLGTGVLSPGRILICQGPAWSILSLQPERARLCDNWYESHGALQNEWSCDAAEIEAAAGRGRNLPDPKSRACPAPVFFRPSPFATRKDRPALFFLGGWESDPSRPLFPFVARVETPLTKVALRVPRNPSTHDLPSWRRIPTGSLL